MIQASLIKEESSRMWLYRFLGQAYDYPEADFVSSLADKKLWVELRTAADTCGYETGQVIDDIETYIRQLYGNQQQLLRDLQVEYTYLFINAIPHVPAPPYESVYAGRGLLMGAPVSEVLSSYREAGLVIKDDYNQLPDHISAELEFISYLIQKEIECEYSGQGEDIKIWRERQIRFLADHLLRWHVPFLDKVNTSARHPFYRCLSMLTRVLLDFDSKLAMAK